jgi:hypothetical protein
MWWGRKQENPVELCTKRRANIHIYGGPTSEEFRKEDERKSKTEQKS